MLPHAGSDSTCILHSSSPRISITLDLPHGSAASRSERPRATKVPLADAPEAYKTFRDKQDGCIKVVLKP